MTGEWSATLVWCRCGDCADFLVDDVPTGVTRSPQGALESFREQKVVMVSLKEVESECEEGSADERG